MGNLIKTKPKGQTKTGRINLFEKGQTFFPLSEQGTVSYSKLSPKQQKELNDKLLYAVEKGIIGDVKTLLRLGADVNVSDKNGWTSLLWAAWKGHTKTCNLLIEHGADVNIQDKIGWTSLILAAENGHTDTCKLLIDKGANMNTQDKWGETALSGAVWNGHTDTCKYLLSIGANPFLKDNEGKTAYDLTEEKEIKQILKKYMGIWKMIGKKNALLIQQSVRNCEPSLILEIFKNL